MVPSKFNGDLSGEGLQIKDCIMVIRLIVSVVKSWLKVVYG